MNTTQNLHESKAVRTIITSIVVVLVSMVALSFGMTVMADISANAQRLAQESIGSKAYGICQSHGERFNPDLAIPSQTSNSRNATYLMKSGHAISLVCVSKSGEVHQYVAKF